MFSYICNIIQSFAFPFNISGLVTSELVSNQIKLIKLNDGILQTQQLYTIYMQGKSCVINFNYSLMII